MGLVLGRKFPAKCRIMACEALWEALHLVDWEDNVRVFAKAGSSLIVKPGTKCLFENMLLNLRTKTEH